MGLENTLYIARFLMVQNKFEITIILSAMYFSA
jgi:hypothetical protein